MSMAVVFTILLIAGVVVLGVVALVGAVLLLTRGRGAARADVES